MDIRQTISKLFLIELFSKKFICGKNKNPKDIKEIQNKANPSARSYERMDKY